MTDTMPMFHSRRDAAQDRRLRVRLPGVRRRWRTRRRRAAADGRDPLAPKTPHFPARAKRVIFLCMEGGPSPRRHVRLQAEARPPTTASRTARAALPAAKLLGSPWKFAQHGQSGLWISRAVPRGRQARRRPVPPQRHADRPAEPPAGVPADAHRQLPVPRGRALGAWALYGLGHRERRTCPASSRISPPANNGGPANYGSAFLPAVYQGTRIGAQRPAGRRRRRSRNVNNPRQSPGRPAARSSTSSRR